MKKMYYVVDGENCHICFTKTITNAFWGYDEPPIMRKGGIMVRMGIDLVLSGICMGFINSKFSFLHSYALEIIAWGMICFALVLFVIGAMYAKTADNDAKEIEYGKSDLPWSDPYHLVDKYPNSDPARKLYYIVDSEKNAIVDVKRLGKWGQRYVEWRGKRQKGGA